MKKGLGPLDFYKFLPKTNCAECGEKTCMAFASQLIERKYKPEDCPYLKDENLIKLSELLAPAVRIVNFGDGESTVRIGGEDVVHRHELTYFNQTAIAIDVHDEMDDKTLLKRVRYVNEFKLQRIGEVLTLQAVAVRNKSDSPEKFKECVKKVSENSKKALILCSWNTESLKPALDIVGDKRPLLYAATKQNWKEVGELALEYNCPLVVFSRDLGEIKSMVNSLQNLGIEEIAMDVGTLPSGKGLSDTLSNFIMARISAIEKEDKLLNCPIVGIPAAVYLHGNDLDTQMKEVMVGAMMIDRFCDLMIIHNTEIWSVMPLVTLRQSIYTDPRKPKAVDAGLREIGTPTPESPLLSTTNFALTYYTVESDIQGLDCYLLVIDTEGLAVDCAIAGGKLDAFKAKKSIEESNVSEKVNHKIIIIPGLAARISGDLENSSGWEVWVGPRDSSGIPNYLKEKWPPEKV